MAKFPSASMIADGEIKNGVISQNPNYTSHENGQSNCCSGNPISFGESMKSTPQHQMVREGSLHGLEEVTWESPLRTDQLPLPRNPGKIAW